jgi:predicted N-acetyltransferase YhbS
MEAQLEWIKNNINQNDYHMMLFDNENVLIGYINFVQRKVLLDVGEQIKVLGIGNVCVARTKQGEGIGKVMMKECNAFLEKNQIPGILLCKDLLVSFYDNLEWELVEKKKCAANLVSLNCNFMTKNLHADYETIDLIGAAF